MNNITTISIKRETRQKLQNLGKMGQSFDEVITELIEKSGGSRFGT